MDKKKGHSAQKVADIYGVRPSKVQSFLSSRGRKTSEPIMGSDNSELARYLSKSPRSLSRKKGKKRAPVEVIKPIKVSPKILAWELARSAKYQEQINLKGKVFKETIVGRDYFDKISRLRDLLPTKVEYLKNLKPKYFLLEDIQVRSGRVKLDPNNQMIEFAKIQPFEGDQAFIRKVIRQKYSKSIYKVFYNDLGKPELNGSSDWVRIRQLIEESIEYRRRDPNYMITSASNVKKTGFQELKIQDLDIQVKKSLYLKSLISCFISSDKAVVLREFNNGVLEDAVLLVGTSNRKSIVFWENLNEARATYVFYSQSLSQQKLKSHVIEIVMSDLQNKRQSLYAGLYKPKLLSVSYSSINHEGLQPFKRKIISVLKGISDE